MQKVCSLIVLVMIMAGCTAGSGRAPGTETRPAVASSTGTAPSTSIQAEKPKAPAQPVKQQKPLFTQGEKTLQLSDLTAQATADDAVKVSLKVKAFAPSNEAVSIVIFSSQTTPLDALELKEEKVERRAFTFYDIDNKRVSTNYKDWATKFITEEKKRKPEAFLFSTYVLDQGTLICFDVSPGQLEHGEIQFSIKNTDWEKPLQIGLAVKITEENYDSYALISNVLAKVK